MMPIRQRLLPLGLVAALAAGVHPLAQTRAVSEVSESRYMAHLKYLASDDLAGRGNGTPGLERAAEYIADQFRAAGLEPGLGRDGRSQKIFIDLCLAG